MDKPVVYHEITPENNVSSTNGFQEHNSIDFVLSADNRVLKQNSIRLDFDVEVYTDLSANTRITQASKIGYENKIGGHSFFSNWRTEVQASGLIETISDYGRWVNMLTSASLPEEAMYSSKYQAEGRGVLVDDGRYALQQVNPNVLPRLSGGGGITADYNGKATNSHLSIAPLICVNRSMGGAYSFNKNGALRISVDCAKIGTALFGGDLQANASAGYKLKNVKMRFISNPDAGNEPKMMMNTIVGIKSTINSQFANISSRVPLKACNAVSISYLEQSKETSRLENSYALEAFPSQTSIQFLFSDATNKFITYRLQDREDILRKGLDALSDSGMNTIDPAHIKSNNGTIAGLGFQQFLDLTSQKFSVQFQTSSALIGSRPRNVFLFFAGMLELQ